MLDLRLNECPVKYKNLYLNMENELQSITDYKDGYVVGFATSKGGRNGLLVIYNKRWEEYEGYFVWDHHFSGNWCTNAATIADLRADVNKYIDRVREYNEGNLMWVELGLDN